MIRFRKLLLLMTAAVLADMAAASDGLWQTFVAPQQEARGMELWNPLTGERRKPADGMLRLRPYESVFVIAR